MDFLNICKGKNKLSTEYEQIIHPKVQVLKLSQITKLKEIPILHLLDSPRLNSFAISNYIKSVDGLGTPTL